jgi:integrase
MGAKKKFPLTIKAGATDIQIYRTTQTSKGKKKRYESYVVSYYRGGTRCRIRRSTLEAAKNEAGRIKASILSEDLTALSLTGTDRLAYVRACGVAESCGMNLDAMVAEFASAKEILGESSMVEAARFYSRFGKSVTAKATVPTIVKELLQELRSNKKTDYHLRNMKCRLERFAEAFPRNIADITTKQISNWLHEVKGTNLSGEKMELGPKSKNHHRNAVAQLFNFARTHGYLPKGIPTEIEGVSLLSVTPKDNEILTCEEMTTLLNAAPDYLVPGLALKAFTGIRTEEFLRLDWSDVNLKSRSIILKAAVTKTRQRRVIPLHDNLREWIEPFHKGKGSVADRWSAPQNFVNTFCKFGRKQGIHVGANKFRNSYISYRVAATQDVQRVALESGNSPTVIQREYLELATEEEGNAWFEIRPKEGRFNQLDLDGPENRPKVRRKKAGKKKATK